MEHPLKNSRVFCRVRYMFYYYEFGMRTLAHCCIMSGRASLKWAAGDLHIASKHINPFIFISLRSLRGLLFADHAAADELRRFCLRNGAAAALIPNANACTRWIIYAWECFSFLFMLGHLQRIYFTIKWIHATTKIFFANTVNKKTEKNYWD